MTVLDILYILIIGYWVYGNVKFYRQMMHDKGDPPAFPGVFVIGGWAAIIIVSIVWLIANIPWDYKIF